MHDLLEFFGGVMAGNPLAIAKLVHERNVQFGGWGRVLDSEL